MRDYPVCLKNPEVDSPQKKWDFFCKQVNDILSLEWNKQWELRFQWWKEGWWNDYDIRIKYTIKIICPKHWSDSDSFDEIEISLEDFTWVFYGKEIWTSVEQQTLIELYFESKWVDIIDMIRKYYYWDDTLA